MPKVDYIILNCSLARYLSELMVSGLVCAGRRVFPEFGFLARPPCAVLLPLVVRSSFWKSELDTKVSDLNCLVFDSESLKSMF